MIIGAAATAKNVRIKRDKMNIHTRWCTDSI